VKEVANQGDTVWVHDYQLMLLPALLRRDRPDLRIGFFLHTPFPSYEVFRAIPEREALLEGLLGSDLVGFHTFGYVRHFRSCLLRLLGVESQVDHAQIETGREVRLGVYPIGHDRVGFEEALASDAFAAYLEEDELRSDNRRLVLSVERLDYTKGLPEKLEAIEHYLDTHPGACREVVFVIIAVPSRQDVEAYQILTADVERTISNINGKHGTVNEVPIHFLHRGVDRARLAALYARAKVCLVTPLVDGMNLVAKEFLACNAAHPKGGPGVLVLSEFAGAAQELSSAVHVNPYDTAAVGRVIAEALATPPDRIESQNAPMRRHVLRHDARAWATRYLADLDAHATAAVRDPASPLDAETWRGLAASDNLALFLDYDGTLVTLREDPSLAVPDRRLHALLERLSERPGTKLAIVSGRQADFLDEHLGRYPITLVAEHGFRLRRPGEGWVPMAPDVSFAWKDHLLPMLQLAADHTPGSWVEEKRSALVWHYRAADPEFGAWKAQGLLAELTGLTANQPLLVRSGKKIVEVSSQETSKGVTVAHLLTEWAPATAVAIGDDLTDETMFELADDHPELVTAKVGKGATRARFRLESAAAVRAHLEALLRG